MAAETLTSIEFPSPFGEREAFEAESRGYLSHVFVLVGIRRYRVTFYDPVRLSQDLEEMARLGTGYLAEAGLIVLPSVTPEAIRMAVDGLREDGFFDGLVPFAEGSA